VSTWSSSTREAPTCAPPRRRNVNAIAPPTAIGVDLLEQLLEHEQLVADLRPAEHGDVGPRRVGLQATEHLELALEQQARVAGSAPGPR
jgi:hypothetical protein